MEKINAEKDEKLNILTSKCEKLEEIIQQKPTKTVEMSVPLLKNSTSIIAEESVENDSHENLLCDYCDFIGKTEGGLKTHMRFKHTKILNQLGWKHCKFCNYNCKTESEMKTHTNFYRITHNETKYTEVSKLHNKGFFLYTFGSEEAQKRFLVQQQ